MKIKFNDIDELDQIYNELKNKFKNSTLEKFKPDRSKSNDGLDLDNI
jgi:hypothetical protein